MTKNIIISVLLFFLSCEEKIVYEYIAFRDNNTKIWKDTIPEKWKDKMKNGDWTFNDEKNNLIFHGKYNHGFRIVEWIYYPSDTQTVKIDWTKYINKDETVAINYPGNWEIHEAENRIPGDNGDSNEDRTPRVGLAHELSHANDNDKGNNKGEIDKRTGLDKGEIRAVNLENKVRPVNWR